MFNYFNICAFEGFRKSTNIHMTGEIESSKVTVSCFSCRQPYGYNVEFLLNGISEDSITLNYETGKCTHKLGECSSAVCSCSPYGNEYSLSFYMKDASKAVDFSCDMMFVDTIASSRFSKNATVTYDGTGTKIRLPFWISFLLTKIGWQGKQKYFIALKH